MDVVLVGLPGSGKSAIGRRLAARHGATFIDVDQVIERETGATVPELFAAEGEAGFRTRERAAIEALGQADGSAEIVRVIAPGGGAIVDPHNRWRLFRGRRAIWLDARPEAIAQRLRNSPFVRPLVRGHDPLRAVRELGAARLRFYASATRVNAMMEVTAVVAAVEAELAAGTSTGTVLVRAETPIGNIVVGEDIAAGEVAMALRALDARRAILVSEGAAWAAVGKALGGALAAGGLGVELVELPAGEAAKTLAAIAAAASALARLGVGRDEPLVAIGGGALTDAAGFLAATYLRGVPIIHVPTTLVGQVDAAIGGKTAVDLPEGKNLVGAFHQPHSIVIDVAVLATLPERDRRAALGEAVKIAALGNEPLFDLLEQDGPAIAAGDPAAANSGAVAELVERTAWAKVEVVIEDERESGGRIALNLGHSLAHALEAAAGFRGLLHGEAVGYGLRAAARIGVERDITPPPRARRIEALLDRLELGRAPLELDLDATIQALDVDKKRRDGQLRWVLPTGDGYALDAEVPSALVRSVAADVIAGRPAPAEAVAR